MAGFGVADPLDAERLGREPAAEAEGAFLHLDGRLGLVEDAEQFGHDLVAVPIVVLFVLQPLEVGYDHPARVAEHVGDDIDVAAFLNDAIRLVRSRSVGPLGEHAALEFCGVFGRDDAGQGGRDEDRALHGEQFIVGDGIAFVAVDQVALVFNVFGGLAHVDALGVVDAAGPVRDRDDLGAVVLQRKGGLAADIAESLNRDGRVLHGDVEILEVTFDQVGDAGAGGFPSTLGAAQGNGFPGDNGRLNMPDVIGVGVHHPAHDFFVRAHVGGGHVDVWAYKGDEFLHVATREALQFALR